MKSIRKALVAAVCVYVAAVASTAVAQQPGNGATFSTAVRATVPNVTASGSNTSGTNCDSPTFRKMESQAQLALKMRSEHLQSLFDRVKRMDVTDMSCLDMFLSSLSFEFMSFFNMSNIVGMVMQALIDYVCDEVNNAYQNAVGDLNSALSNNLRFDVDGIGTVASVGTGIRNGRAASRWSDKPVNYSTRYNIQGTNGQTIQGGATSAPNAPAGGGFNQYR